MTTRAVSSRDAALSGQDSGRTRLRLMRESQPWPNAGVAASLRRHARRDNTGISGGIHVIVRRTTRIKAARADRKD